MKKRLSLGFLVLMLLFTTGCSRILKTTIDTMVNDKSQEKVFVIEDYNLELTATNEWEETSGTAFDLKITDDNSYISVMSYFSIDLAKEDTPQSIYQLQNEDIFSKRDNVEVIEELSTTEVNGKIMETMLYSAERDGARNYYYSTLVTFRETEDVFAWVIITGTPSYLVNNKEKLMGIVSTLEYKAE